MTYFKNRIGLKIPVPDPGSGMSSGFIRDTSMKYRADMANRIIGL
jgi:hypothetical protein